MQERFLIQPKPNLYTKIKLPFYDIRRLAAPRQEVWGEGGG